MRYFLTVICLAVVTGLFAQIFDDFSDNDFTTNPTWSGTTADYVVNGTQELQLNNTIAATSYLSTPHGLATLDNKEWNFWVRQSFSPSGGNFGRVYLTSTSSDLTTDPDGFYLLFGEGGANDAVRLFKVESTIHTEILAGPAAQIASSFAIGVRIVRDNAGNWTLYIDETGGTNYAQVATGNDATSLIGSHFGVYDVYTVSNSTSFYYDNFYVGDEILDVTPPTLVSVDVINANLLDVYFNEALNQTAAELSANYSYSPNGSVMTPTLDGTNPALVHLVPTIPFVNGESYTLTVSNAEDLSSNVAGDQSLPFQYLVPETPEFGDVVINEFLCDPTPSVNLPESEFVEVLNVSNKILDLSNWKLGDASSQGTVQSGTLLPGEYMILCSTSSVDSFSLASAVTSFPSLNNSGDNIVLRDDNGLLIDSISYTQDWYHDESKDGGGYSIERINPEDPCTDIFDWSASNSLDGGTPGVVNSVYNASADILAPEFDQLVALAPNYLEIYFNEGMDSTSLANATMTFSPNLTVAQVYILSEHPTMITVEFVENLTGSTTYNLEIENISDCWLNTTNLNGDFALPETPEVGDIVINEILFNPITGGYDWVEVYNNSQKLIDLYNWDIANYDNDTIDNHKLVEEHYLLYPNSYMIFAEDTSSVKTNFPAYVMGNSLEMDLPTFSNDSGTVYIQYFGETIDKVSYDADWHFDLLDDEDGKSLERIDPNGNSNSSNNWHTAAESIGFGTPGRENSQLNPITVEGEFEYETSVISPDSDGFQDNLFVVYEMPTSGMLANFVIYDDRGRRVAEVLKSELLGQKGSFTWQGVADDGSKASIGVYVGVFEAFDLDGTLVFSDKKAFTVAGKL